MNAKNILIGGAAFVGALYFFSRGIRPQVQAAGASGYIAAPKKQVNYVANAPVYMKSDGEWSLIDQFNAQGFGL